MPNWTSNRIYIEGDQADIRAFLEAVKWEDRIWLVGDDGVYLMPNTEGETRTIAYAKECDPMKLEFDDWWHVKRATFGGDDGVEFISIGEIERISAGSPGAQPKSLCISFTPKRMTISVQWKRTIRKGGAA